MEPHRHYWRKKTSCIQFMVTNKQLLLLFFKRNVLLSINAENILARQRFVLFRLFSFTGALVSAGVFIKMYCTIGALSITHYFIPVLSIILLFNFLRIKSKAQLKKGYVVAVTACFMLLHLVSYDSGGIVTSGSVYFLVVILYAYALLGQKAGKYFTIASIVHIVYLFLLSRYTHLTSFEMFNNNNNLFQEDAVVNFICAFCLIAAQHSYLEDGKNEIIRRITNAKDDLANTNMILNGYNNALVKNNRELNKFAHVVSHDLKAPLRAIGTLSDIIAEDESHNISTDSKNSFNVIKNRVARMDNLLNGILEYTYAGRKQDKIEKINVNDFVKEIHLKLTAIIGKNSLTINGILPAINADKEKLNQIFVQLISNAITHNFKEEKKVTVSYLETETHHQFEIADNGNGIEAEFYERIFIIFQTLLPRDQLESTGIGLAITKKIVEDLGGKIWVSSVVKKGSSFFFTIPKNHNNKVAELIKSKLIAVDNGFSS